MFLLLVSFQYVYNKALRAVGSTSFWPVWFDLAVCWEDRHSEPATGAPQCEENGIRIEKDPPSRLKTRFR